MKWIEMIPGVWKVRGFTGIALYSQHIHHPPGTWVLIAPGIQKNIGGGLMPEEAIARATEILTSEGVK